MGYINIKLITSVFTVNFVAFAVGNSYAWSSTVLTDLKSNDSKRNPLGRPITSFEEAWIASLINLGASCGPILAGYCSDKLGRKKTLLIFSIPMLISHLMVAFATTPEEFFIARFILGLGVGTVFTVVPIYVGEVAETKIRGLLGCFMGVLISMGLLFVYAVGPFVYISTLSFMLMVPIVLFLFFFGLFVPESPYFYVATGNDLVAEISLNKLRNKDSCSNLKELADIKKTVEESRSGGTSLYNIFKCRSFRKGITITSTLMVFQQCAGISIILSYMESIFIASGSSISSSTSTIIVGGIQTCAVILSSYLADKWGRRMLLIVSSAGSALPLFSLGLYFFIKNSGTDVSSLWWLPILSLIIFIICFNFGLSSLPWALVGELFSTNTKSLASTITATTCLTLAFTMTFIFPKLEKVIGFSGVFWLFGATAIKCLLFVLWYVPETKGKTFQEVLRILSK